MRKSPKGSCQRPPEKIDQFKAVLRRLTGSKQSWRVLSGGVGILRAWSRRRGVGGGRSDCIRIGISGQDEQQQPGGLRHRCSSFITWPCAPSSHGARIDAQKLTGARTGQAMPAHQCAKCVWRVGWDHRARSSSRAATNASPASRIKRAKMMVMSLLLSRSRLRAFVARPRVRSR